MEEDVYMYMPPKYEKVGLCCRLRKALYCFKRSSRVWFERLMLVMKNQRYSQEDGGHTLFVNKNVLKVIILLVYLDDMIVTNDDIEEIAKK